MKPMKEIETLLTEAETGKTSRVFERITDEAKPFGMVQKKGLLLVDLSNHTQYIEYYVMNMVLR